MFLSYDPETGILKQARPGDVLVKQTFVGGQIIWEEVTTDNLVTVMSYQCETTFKQSPYYCKTNKDCIAAQEWVENTKHERRNQKGS